MRSQPTAHNARGSNNGLAHSRSHEHTYMPICMPTYMPTYIPTAMGDEDSSAFLEGAHELMAFEPLIKALDHLPTNDHMRPRAGEHEDHMRPGLVSMRLRWGPGLVSMRTP